MDRGTYIAASAGMAQMRRLEVVNNNLANINTPSFKRELVTSTEQKFDDTLAKAQNTEAIDPFAKGDHQRTPGVVQVESKTDFTQGGIRNTGNSLDVALANKNDFFVINTPQGPQYTRAGNFTLAGEGVLSTQDGNAVASDGGTITAEGPNVKINSDGSVSSKGQVVGQLQVVRFEDTKDLVRMGDNRFTVRQGGAQPVAAEIVKLVPASLEMANVSAISSMVEMISAQRGFQMYTKTSESIDQLNQIAINQIGRRT